MAGTRNENGTNKTESPPKILHSPEWRPVGRRRPRKRWIKDLEEDLRNMWIRRWRRLSYERAEWRKPILICTTPVEDELLKTELFF